jgi:ribosome biogenesis GTPase A
MAAGIRAMLDVADLIDVVIEVRDARMPRSTAVLASQPRLARKSTIALLNRSDLADPRATNAWLASLDRSGVRAYACVATRAKTLNELRADLLARPRKRGVLRAAVMGAPNTGKSSVINALGRAKRTIVADKPGVTRHVRWLKIEGGVELLDTPGLLRPRIESDDAAWQLALCGTLPETAMDVETTAARFHDWLREHRPDAAHRADLDAFASRHGMRRRGGELDRRNAARKLLSEFRAGRLFRLTFEQPEQGA